MDDGALDLVGELLVVRDHGGVWLNVPTKNFMSLKLVELCKTLVVEAAGFLLHKPYGIVERGQRVGPAGDFGFDLIG